MGLYQFPGVPGVVPDIFPDFMFMKSKEIPEFPEFFRACARTRVFFSE